MNLFYIKSEELKRKNSINLNWNNSTNKSLLKTTLEKYSDDKLEKTNLIVN